MVVAESAAIAEDARDLIEVDYNDLPAVTEFGAAVAEGAPQLHADAPGNLAFETTLDHGLVAERRMFQILVGTEDRLMPLDIVWLSGPNPAILLATFGFCLLGTLAFALGPALKLSRAEVVEELKEDPDTTSGVALGSDEPVIWPPSTAPFVWQVRFGPCR